MDARRVELTGHVERAAVDAGSKSERDAVTFRTDDGTTYVLRKEGAPAFGDTSLDPMVGGKHTFQGVTVGNLFIVR